VLRRSLAFHRQRIASYAAEMVGLASEVRNRWQAGSRIDFSQEMMQLTLCIVGKVLFGTDLRQEAPELVGAVNSIMNLYNLMILVPAAERLINLPLPGALAFRRRRARVDQTVYRMIAEHRAGLRAEWDLLSMMLESHQQDDSGDDQLRDEVVTVLLAGYETVADALTWTGYLLSTNPDVDARLKAELDEVLGERLPEASDYPRLHYTEMVLAESMRLYPPAWGMGRLAIADFELPPYSFPAGTTVAICQFLMHRDERYFPDPLRFDPDRFTSEPKARRPRFAYFPFGGGARQCIEESFAWMEGVLVPPDSAILSDDPLRVTSLEWQTNWR
jgi:cytochrome P450